MEHACVFDAGHNLLRVTVAGPFTLTEAQATFLETLDAVVKYQTRKVLIDGRAVTGEPQTIERFFYGKFVASAVAEVDRHTLGYAPQFAYVLTEPVLDAHRFGETVATNRGMHIKAFDNPGAAERWLGVA